MSEVPQGPEWWQATDGKWYPPEQHPHYQPQPPPPPPVPVPPLIPATTPPTMSPHSWQAPVAQTTVLTPLGKDRSPASVLGLSIITLGIYYIVWYYKINNEIRQHDPDIKVSPGWAAAAISIGSILLFIPPLVSSYTTAARIRQMQLDDGATQTISPVVALLLHIFLGIGYPLYIASQLREHWHGHRRTIGPTASGMQMTAGPWSQQGAPLPNQPPSTP